MGKVWEIDNHTFPIIWVLFSHLILILWYTSAYRKCMVFPINFSFYGKMQQSPSYGVNLGNWYPYFSRSMDAFSPYDSHPTVYYIIWKIHGFPHQFPIVQENATKLNVWENLGNWCSYFSNIMDAFFPLDSRSMVYFITWEMHVFAH